jgi:transposase
VHVYLACGVTDMRKGIDGLMVLVQSSLRQKPASGSVFAFQGRRGDRIKLLFWDGQGFCLYYKVLEKGRFARKPYSSSMLAAHMETSFRVGNGG